MADPPEQTEGQTDSPGVAQWREQLERERDDQKSQNAELQKKAALFEVGYTGLSDEQLGDLLALAHGDLSPESLRAAGRKLGYDAEKGPDSRARPEPAPAPEVTEHDDEAREIGELSDTPQSERDDTLPSDLNTRIAKAQSPEELKQILRDANMLMENY